MAVESCRTWQLAWRTSRSAWTRSQRRVVARRARHSACYKAGLRSCMVWAVKAVGQASRRMAPSARRPWRGCWVWPGWQQSGPRWPWESGRRCTVSSGGAVASTWRVAGARMGRAWRWPWFQWSSTSVPFSTRVATRRRCPWTVSCVGNAPGAGGSCCSRALKWGGTWRWHCTLRRRLHVCSGKSQRTSSSYVASPFSRLMTRQVH
mmetsp:Transcript_41251/g.127998  ORF Transcript_41251/g.127998 Transcript_41251/m.127998 type:complete len:206 (+) Transcript_41251:94-711(+)